MRYRYLINWPSIGDRKSQIFPSSRSNTCQMMISIAHPSGARDVPRNCVSVWLHVQSSGKDNEFEWLCRNRGELCALRPRTARARPAPLCRRRSPHAVVTSAVSCHAPCRDREWILTNICFKTQFSVTQGRTLWLEYSCKYLNVRIMS